MLFVKKHFWVAEARQLLEEVKGKKLSVAERAERSVKLAGLMLNEAAEHQLHREKQQEQQLARMMNDPAGKAFVTEMTDQCFRSHNPKRVANQLVYLINALGIPKFFSFFKRTQLFLFKWIGCHFSRFTIPLIKRALRKEASMVILPGEPEQLSLHMKQRCAEGVRINLNHIGEAILGEEEANRRLEAYLKDLANPEVECVSIKASTIFSQINLIGSEETLNILGERLKRLYRVAQENYFVRKDGETVSKFVYLDMEEYRDLHLTVELFRRVLEDAEFYRYSAGVVLQSYLPDAFMIQQGLTVWGIQRTANGGGPIKIRIVKGANLGMEKVEASMKLWDQAPYLKKEETDANYKRMVTYGCSPDKIKSVHLGIASHNLFDIAYAMILRAEKEIESYVGFEMLEGMADHLRRVVHEISGNMLLYCPAAKEEEFQNAIAYLTRRLDENTAPANFLRHIFEMSPGTKEWHRQADLFTAACHDQNNVSYMPRRTQNRFEQPIRSNFEAPFKNEADTDWSLIQNVKWVETIFRKWSVIKIDPIPLVIGSRCIDSGVDFVKGIDPSFPDRELYRYAVGEGEHVEIALTTALEAFGVWSANSFQLRMLLLDEVAYRLQCHRGDLIGALVADTGKTVAEADVEVSEAIDFVTYYRRSAEEWHSMKDIGWRGKGVVLVAPPWNFACSIAIGGIVAALAAGNSVIFKPAPEAILVGWKLVNILWDAGIDKSILQFFSCLDEPTGSRLIKDSRLAAVVLTGATSTAELFLRIRPEIDLIAETGGKNAMIITCMADRDLAIRDLVQSAFGYAGQKCSACSLAILEKEVYDDPHFRRQLKDAASSLHVGSSWNLSTKVNPLIREPGEDLLRALTTLEEGEEWLLEPHCDQKNPLLWSPGIKLGVKAGSFMHQTELFGPILGMMCADNLKEAIKLSNGTSYGLTAGLHSLDEQEHKIWTDHIVAGNCYINRTTTGAVVRRQPFGGCKDSSFGPGAKAGGPNYVMQLMQLEEKILPIEQLQTRLPVPECENTELWKASIESYQYYWGRYFSKEHDPSAVWGQENPFFYKPLASLIFRVHPQDSLLDISRVITAAKICGVPLDISMEFRRKGVKAAHIESDGSFAQRVVLRKTSKVRMLTPASDPIRRILAEASCHVIVAPVAANGRIELLRFFREVSLSVDYHRYGYVKTRPAPLNPATVRL
ncbi:MAG: proline dehydrogenase family protein [Parachlamydiaceae bacterium]